MSPEEQEEDGRGSTTARCRARPWRHSAWSLPGGAWSRNEEARSSVPSGAFCVGWRLTPTPGRTGQGERQEDTRSGKHGKGRPLRMDGAGSPGSGCACRAARCTEAGHGQGGKLSNGGSPGSWGPQLSQPNRRVHCFLGEPAASKVYLFSILNLEATSQRVCRLQTSHPT